MMEPTIGLNYIGTLRCSKCGGDLTRVKIKEQFIDKTKDIDDSKIDRYMCLRCVQASHEIRESLLGTIEADKLYPIETILDGE